MIFSKRNRSKRILFMSSNGVGVGHLSRLVSIARRLPKQAEAVFFTMSQALPVVQQFGFHAEYFPCFRYGQSDFDNWNDWLSLTLGQMLDAYDIRSIAFDGNMLYPGLCQAVSSRPDCRLIWIRRGMWRADQNNTQHLEQGAHADLVIEPDDIAAELDSGAATQPGENSILVDPIRLLDTHEILDRSESCMKLGLQPNERYALIQLGAGNNYNFIDLMDRLIATLRSAGSIRPVLAQWLTSDLSLDLWPDVPRICCFPISRYYNAFDFTISAVGYNSFNEIISFGVPSIFVPNLNQAMDDQAARATFAEQNSAAIHLHTATQPDLEKVLAQMQSDKFRQSLRTNCMKITKPNGAKAAAHHICEISGIASAANGH
ncbi:MAG: UDP-N-acetylglucosamine--N-acetylmuramyl-(pentapeptide) pyrophosphoryl-undecaprenol N-acetylglucosamine transferase [bacterium]|nr:UDP-N-acetylglucosamine--N-acetylmuramyl-(pentapeptide) pyrophosphoryl-undecaprenol N-acetylglucosamine transferase [bacterium]